MYSFSFNVLLIHFSFLSEHCSPIEQFSQSRLFHYICYKNTSDDRYDDSGKCMNNSRGIKCKERKIELSQHSKDGMKQIDGQGVCSNEQDMLIQTPRTHKGAQPREEGNEAIHNSQYGNASPVPHVVVEQQDDDRQYCKGRFLEEVIETDMGLAQRCAEDVVGYGFDGENW